MPATVRLGLLVALVVASHSSPQAAADEPAKKDERPPYQRLLQGDDAKQAAELQKRSVEKEAADQYAEAIAAAEQLLALRARVQGADHHETVSQRWQVERLRKLAALPADQRREWPEGLTKYRQGLQLQAQWRYREALPLFQESADTAARLLGEAHPSTASGYHSVASCLKDQGKAAEALPLFQKALAIKRQSLGEAHPDTATSCNNVAACLHDQGKAGEALPLYQKALAIYRQSLGEAHPHTAATYNNVAGCLRDQGKAAEALPLYHKALAIRRRSLGEAHPLTAHSYHSVAACLHDQGKAAEALPLYHKALAITRQSLGEDHPDTALGYNNVVACLQAQGKAPEALPFCQKALAITRQSLGEDHPLTASSYLNLAGCLQAQGKAGEALPFCQRALAITRQSLGEAHPLTVQSYHNAAGCLNDQGKAGEALPLFQQALAIRRQTLGEAHPLTAHSYHNVAGCLQAQGKHAEAARHWQQALLGFEFGRLAAADRGLDRALFRARSLSPRLALAATLAELGQPARAWEHAESDLGRGLLDEVATPAQLSLSEQEQLSQLKALQAQLLPLLTVSQPSDDQRQQIRDLSAQRARLQQALAEAGVRRSRDRVLSLPQVQQQIPDDAALIFWLDAPALKQRRGCVLRSQGEPHWVALPGSGAPGEWTDGDDTLVHRTRVALAGSGGDATILALCRQLQRQRLTPLEPHLRGVRRLFVVPVQAMSALPVSALTETYTISYVPSGTHLARILRQPRHAAPPRLLALGDPVCAQPEVVGKDTALPEHGLLLTQVQPGGNAQRSGLRPGDVLLRYAGKTLATLDDLQPKADAGDVAVEAWRDGQVLKLTVRPGPLSVALDRRPTRQAIAAREDADRLLAAATSGPALQPLPGTRREVEALVRLIPAHDVLLGRDASEARLDALRAEKKLGRYTHLHFATHGLANDEMAFESALALAQDDLPDNADRVAKGLKPIDGRLSAREVLQTWQLNAELVVLSACASGLGRYGGGDGLLGFAQAFLLAGARSVVLSLWQVDDTATALLMQRFYQNLLGKRDGLVKPLPKAEALREAQRWLRELSREQVEAEVKLLPATRGGVRSKTAAETVADKPYAHPHYWAAFILIGDPN